MRITRLSSILCLCALPLVACGGSKTPAETTPAAESGDGAATGADHEEASAAGEAGAKGLEHEGHEEGGEHASGAHEGQPHEHNFPGAVNGFHDVLAPVWHAESGKAAKACAAADEFVAEIQAVEGMEVPEGVDAGQWAEAVAALRQEVDGLVASCPDQEPALQALHEAFHGLVALVGHQE